MKNYLDLYAQTKAPTSKKITASVAVPANCNHIDKFQTYEKRKAKGAIPIIDVKK